MLNQPPKPPPPSPAEPAPFLLQSLLADSLPKRARNTLHPEHAAPILHRAARLQSSSVSTHAPAPTRYKTPLPAFPLHPRIPAAAEQAHIHTSDRESTQSIQTTST